MTQGKYPECLRQLGDQRRAQGQSLRDFSGSSVHYRKSTLSFLGQWSGKVTKNGFSLAVNCYLVLSEGRQGNESEACFVAAGRPRYSHCQGGAEQIPWCWLGSMASNVSLGSDAFKWTGLILQLRWGKIVWVKKKIWVEPGGGNNQQQWAQGASGSSSHWKSLWFCLLWSPHNKGRTTLVCPSTHTLISQTPKQQLPVYFFQKTTTAKT